METSDTMMPAGWGWHPKTTVKDVALYFDVVTMSVEQRRGSVVSSSKRKEIPSSIKERIKELYDANVSIREIAKQLNLSPAAVFRNVKQKTTPK